MVSAVEYARNAAAYHLLPDLAISCDGPVHSVALFSKRPVAELIGAPCWSRASSRTSVLLLELLCRHRWGVVPDFATARAEAADLDDLARLPHEAVLVIGDAALLLLRAQARYPVRVDLGEEWKAWTGLPFVFAVWAARRDAPRAAVRRCISGCWSPAPGASRIWIELAHEAARRHRRGGAGLPGVSGRSGLRPVLPAPGGAHRLLPQAGAGRAGARRITLVYISSVR